MQYFLGSVRELNAPKLAATSRNTGTEYRNNSGRFGRTCSRGFGALPFYLLVHVTPPKISSLAIIPYYRSGASAAYAEAVRNTGL